MSVRERFSDLCILSRTCTSNVPFTRPMTHHHQARIVSMQANELFTQCLICEDTNCKKNYGIQSCESCKIFFRRHAREDSNRNLCPFDGQCQINKSTRQSCRACRLKKCFSVGMQIDLLRSSHGRRLSISSLLTDQQWTLISKITNGYNERSPMGYIRYLISSLSSHLPKIRLKIANHHLMNMIQSVYLVIEPFVNIIPELNQMNPNDRIALIERNIRNLGGFNGVFVLQETEILSDVAYSQSLLSIYGTCFYNQINRMIDQAQHDGTLVKLFLVILAFSTCSDVVSQNQFGNTRILINTECLFRLQNIYTEMMFKYMIYRYGYEQATLRFAYLIKCLLYQSILTANAEEVTRHQLMIETVIDKLRQSIVLED